MGRKPRDYVGMRFGRLTVLRDAPNVNGKRYVDCLCDCGQERTFMLSNLRTGRCHSCGCLRVERLKTTAADILNRDNQNDD